MRSFDFAPLYRATVGFDRVADLMDRVLTADVAQPTYPPYNIEKTAEDAYRISIAVAGFAPEELSVEVKDGNLLQRRVATSARRVLGALIPRLQVLSEPELQIVVDGTSTERPSSLDTTTAPSRTPT